MHIIWRTDFYKVRLKPPIRTEYEVLATKKEVQNLLKQKITREQIQNIIKVYLEGGYPSYSSVSVKQEFFPKNYYTTLKGYPLKQWQEVDNWLSNQRYM